MFRGNLLSIETGSAASLPSDARLCAMLTLRHTLPLQIQTTVIKEKILDQGALALWILREEPAGHVRHHLLIR
jgi:plasmid rolling circle replication initiator protein Rep